MYTLRYWALNKGRKQDTWMGMKSYSYVGLDMMLLFADTAGLELIDRFDTIMPSQCHASAVS
ncbi:uncharacterized protein RCO7_14250 [Rhynchosporium graminicola]|uniref:Uncharacterized protein n=2 Tax=Rhynchosporium TaxID=38037 RepID=A0A1E1M021_RHYSE|nr:uncharacterized protein RCO7_14250 [Rhynchosporium commune]CZT42446.1 uncharacterized protein RSE6_02357 [Rhynchosporium secalis]